MLRPKSFSLPSPVNIFFDMWLNNTVWFGLCSREIENFMVMDPRLVTRLAN